MIAQGAGQAGGGLGAAFAAPPASSGATSGNSQAGVAVQTGDFIITSSGNTVGSRFGSAMGNSAQFNSEGLLQRSTIGGSNNQWLDIALVGLAGVLVWLLVTNK
jgi:hypothetical protein